MHRLALLLVPLVTASPQAAPSPQPSASPPAAAPARTQSTTLAIPASWHALPLPAGKPAGFFKIVGIWGIGDESIVLNVSPSLGYDLEQITTRLMQETKGRDPSLALRESGTVRLCRGSSGLKETYQDSAGDALTYVTAVTRARVYVAAFTYSIKTGPSPEGEAAAESLCPPPDPVVHVSRPPIDAPAWPAQNPDSYFTPAAGYEFWVWDRHPGDAMSQRIFVTTFPMRERGSLSYSFTAVVARFSKGPTTVTQRLPMVLCRATDGVYVSVTTMRSRGPLVMEGVMTAVRHVAYAAIYVHAAADSPRPDAERAIRSLCPASR
ncbi:MAG TPA: hypothetical protein VFE16_13190 [Candidatus Cybelea sp.]|jgi:hypothetical protein|nr:hypothetical protein [Candidatus Cybelea sp.]